MGLFKEDDARRFLSGRRKTRLAEGLVCDGRLNRDGSALIDGELVARVLQATGRSKFLGLRDISNLNMEALI